MILAAFGFKGDQSFRFCRVVPGDMHQAVAVRVLPAAAPTTESPPAGTPWRNVLEGFGSDDDPSSKGHR
jgi:hypothetical protein